MAKIQLDIPSDFHLDLTREQGRMQQQTGQKVSKAAVIVAILQTYFKTSKSKKA